MAEHMTPVDSALYTLLSTSTALTSLLSGGTADPSVYQWLAPEGTDEPYVVFQTQSPSVPVRTLNAIAYENALYTAKGVTRGPSARAAGTIADAIETALSTAALSVTGYNHVLCRREQDIDFIEVADGQRYTHRGAIYRVQVDPT